VTNRKPSAKRSHKQAPAAEQLVLFKQRGGKRRGVGRPPAGARAGSPHKVRPYLHARYPVHVVLRVVAAVYSLRRRLAYHAICSAQPIAPSRRANAPPRSWCCMPDHVTTPRASADRLPPSSAHIRRSQATDLCGDLMLACDACEVAARRGQVDKQRARGKTGYRTSKVTAR